MRYLSVCSGIEACSVAWTPLGWSPVAFSEIEPFPCAVLRHHYPTVPNLGDMTKFREWPDATIDLLVGGTPCQSFSVAGLRKGLDDPRGNLALTYLAIAERYRPQWLVWENVPGVLSSISHAAPDPRPPQMPVDMGREVQDVEIEDEYDAEELHAFECFLSGLQELGYGYAYCTFDAQHLGVPQRRRRIIVVGYLGEWGPPSAVLFERHSLSGNSPPSRKARQDVAGTITSSAGSRGAEDAERGQLIAHPLLAKGNDSHDDSKQTYVTNALTGEGFDASEDGTGRGVPIIPTGITLHGNDRTRRVASLSDSSTALRARAPGNSEGSSTTVVLQPITFDTTQITNKDNRSNPLPGDPCHPLAATQHAPAIAFQYKQSASSRSPSFDDVAPTLDNAKAGGTAIAFSCKDSGADATDDVAPTLRAMNEQDGNANAGGQIAVVLQPRIERQSAVRRLTPRECERLQGLPDDYTLVPYKRKPAKDGPRYKAIGNSMAIPMMRKVAERIDMVQTILQTRHDAATGG